MIYNQDEDNVLAEVQSGTLSAVIVLAGDKAMKGEAGPLIWTTLDDSRVVVSFNEKAFNWRVKKMVEHFTKKNPDEDPNSIERECRNKIGDKMLQQSMDALDQYFIAKGLTHLGEDEDA